MGDKLRRIEKALSKPVCRKLGDFTTLVFFAIVVLLPTIYVFSFVFIEWDGIFQSIFNDPIAGNIRWEGMQRAILLSFQIAALATIIDIIIGLPVAVILARYEFRGKKFIDTLIDLPLAVPSSALGLSISLFWTTRTGISSLFGWETGLLSEGPLLILLAHIAFTYPYIVRSLSGVIESVDVTYEHAGRTLGAAPFTVFRTITSPLAKPGLIAGSILAFTRSLGETGATLIVAGVYETSPLVVVSWHKMFLIPEAAFLSMVLVGLASLLLLIIRFVSRRFGIPIKKVWPGPERFLSGVSQRRIRDFLTFASFGLIVLIPSSFTFSYVAAWWSGSPYTGEFRSGVLYQVFGAPDYKWRTLYTSLITSIEVALIATLVNLVIGISMAMIIVRRKWGKVNEFINALIDVPLAIPTSALGFSVFLFWGSKGAGIFNPGFWLMTLVHIAFTHPYVVRTLVAILEGMDPSLEEAARTLGASPLTTFRTVLLPLMKPGILAAAILAFTRSLGETGATIVVMGMARTVPVLIVEWVEAMALPAAVFACVVLILISYSLLLAFRYAMAGVR